MLKVLEDARLVTAEWEQSATNGEETPETVYVDVTHEALIREWRTLDDWLHEDRDGLLIDRRLTESAQWWVQLKGDPGALLRGVRLAQTVEWATAHGGDLNDQEREFLAASREQAEAEQHEQERIQHEREKRSSGNWSRRRRWRQKSRRARERIEAVGGGGRLVVVLALRSLVCCLDSTARCSQSTARCGLSTARADK